MIREPWDLDSIITTPHPILQTKELNLRNLKWFIHSDTIIKLVRLKLISFLQIQMFTVHFLNLGGLLPKNVHI
jgi:hypothetical protein